MKFQYCPYCKSDLVEDDNTYKCKKNNHLIYKNSIPAAAVVPVKGNKILLGRRSRSPQKGKWDVIGGFVEAGEDPKEAAVREAKEETNLDVKILDFIGIYMDKYLYNGTNFDVMIIYYVVDAKGEAIPADDVGEIMWFDIDDLPEKEFAFDHLTHGLRDVKKWMMNHK